MRNCRELSPWRIRPPTANPNDLFDAVPRGTGHNPEKPVNDCGLLPKFPTAALTAHTAASNTGCSAFSANLAVLAAAGLAALARRK